MTRTCRRLQVATSLYRFIEDRRCCPAPASPEAFWAGFDAIVADLRPKNAALLAERDRLQSELDDWYRANPGPITAACGLPQVSREIGYLVPEPKVQGDDEERRCRAGAAGRPAAGGADHQRALRAERRQRALGLAVRRAVRHRRHPEADGCEKGRGYNPKRAAPRSSPTRATCSTDRCAPLAKGSHIDSRRLPRRAGQLVTLKNGTVGLKNPAQFVGFQGDAGAPLGAAVAPRPAPGHPASTSATPSAPPTRRRRRPGGRSGAVDHPGPGGLLVAVVDADDKVVAYGNWLGIIEGTLTEKSPRAADLHGTRGLNPTAATPAPRRRRRVLHGRSLLFVRNVGHLMTNPAILWTAASAGDPGRHHGRGGHHHHHRAARPAAPGQRQRAQRASGARSTSSSRRCTACRSGLRRRAVRPRREDAGPARQHREAGHHGRGAPHQRQPEGLHRRRVPRVAFINTGFLDRTGDEMHTAMLAGPMMRKGDMKAAPGSRPTSATTCWSGWPAAARQGRSARACGPCPT